MSAKKLNLALVHDPSFTLKPRLACTATVFTVFGCSRAPQSKEGCSLDNLSVVWLRYRTVWSGISLDCVFA